MCISVSSTSGPNNRPRVGSTGAGYAPSPRTRRKRSRSTAYAPFSYRDHCWTYHAGVGTTSRPRPCTARLQPRPRYGYGTPPIHQCAGACRGDRHPAVHLQLGHQTCLRLGIARSHGSGLDTPRCSLTGSRVASGYGRRGCHSYPLSIGPPNMVATPV